MTVGFWQYGILKNALGNAGGLRRRLIGGGIGTFALSAASRILSIVATVFLGRLLGVDGYGSYVFAIAIVTLLTIPVQLGLPQLVIRLVAVYHQSGDRGALKGLLIRSIEVVLLLSVVVGVGIFLMLTFSDLSPSIFRVPLLWALSLLPMLALVGLGSAAIRGLGHVSLSQISEQLVRPGFLVLLLTAVWFWGPTSFDASSAVKVNIAATVAALGGCIWMTVRLVAKELREELVAYRDREWFRAALPFAGLAGIDVLLDQMNTVMLGVMAAPSDVGIYRVADQGAFLASFALAAVNVVAAREYAKLHHTGDRVRLQRLAVAGARVALAWAIPVVVVYVIWGDGLLSLIFGSAFSRGHIALTTLALGQLVNAAFGSVGLILNMTGHAWHTAAGYAVAAGANIVLNFILIPIYGIEGAAIASATALVIWNLLLARSLFRLTGVVSFGWARVVW